jgi:preprotein translocase subunit SecB
MTEENGNSSSSKPSAADEQQFHIQRVYLKDLSFETPMGHKAFISKERFKIDQELGVEWKEVDNQLFETTLRLMVSAKLEEETACLVEVHQAGLFYIKGIEGQLLERVMGTACPQVLFPYARETIDNTLVKGTFPAVMLPAVNFDVLFAQTMAEKAAKAGNSETSKPH